MTATQTNKTEHHLPEEFTRHFATISGNLIRETQQFFKTRDQHRSGKADKTFRKSFDEVSEQFKSRQISLGVAIKLIVDGILDHAMSTRKVNMSDLRPLRNVSPRSDIKMTSFGKLRDSDARLYRALTTFLDQERRGWATWCANVSNAATVDLSALRRDFIAEMHEDGYVSYQQEGEDLRVCATSSLREMMNFPLELRPDDIPFSVDLKKIYRKH